MVAKLGGLFFDEAVGPVAAALASLRQGRIEEAVAALDRDRLMGAFRSGVNHVAKAAGIPPMNVFRLLPMDHLDAIVGRVDECQREAMVHWRSHDAHDGGLLSDKVLLGEGEVSDVADGFTRIATTLKREDRVSSAFTALAEDMERWNRALVQARGIIEHAPELARAYRRRRMIMMAAVAVLVVLALGSGVWIAQRRQARARVDAWLAQEPCAVEQIGEADVAQASSEQLSAIESARTACTQQREQAARAAEERRKAEQRRRAAEKAAAERRKRCERLMHDFEAGKLDELDKKEAGAAAALLQRIIDKRLELDDVSETTQPLPCADNDHGAKLRLAYATQLVTSMLKWIQVRTPSKVAIDAIVEHKAELPAFERSLLAGHIEMLAKQAVLSGKDDDLARHATLCRLAFAIEPKKGVNCVAVLDLVK